jgi:hypothetical protein
LERISLQKLLFLVCQKQVSPQYDFIPYHYGSFSHSAQADLKTMVEKGLLSEDPGGYQKKDRTNYLSRLKEEDKVLVNQAYPLYHKLDADALMTYTYTHFPYYAINSKTAPRLLDKSQLENVHSARPVLTNNTLYTIGYEGISLEAYLNKLIQYDIKVLVDVRNNPLSQKFGFSKNQLKCYCEGLNIEYVHFPELGIQSEFRQELNDQTDYDRLFTNYIQKTVPKTIPTQEKLLNLLKEKKRIALTCFESNICQCHRKPLADSITQLPGWNYDVKHI